MRVFHPLRVSEGWGASTGSWRHECCDQVPDRIYRALLSICPDAVIAGTRLALIKFISPSMKLLRESYPEVTSRTVDLIDSQAGEAHCQFNKTEVLNMRIGGGTRGEPCKSE